MADDEDIAALVVDNGSGMCKGKKLYFVGHILFSNPTQTTKKTVAVRTRTCVICFRR